METIFIIICVISLIFIIIKIMIPINRASNYIDVKIEEAIERAKLDAQERLIKRVKYLQKRYGEDGLIAYEDLHKVGTMDFKNSDNNK